MNEVQSIRLTVDEQQYIESQQQGKFSPYIHDLIEQDMKKKDIQNKKNRIDQYTQELVMLGIGAIFIIFSVDQSLYGFLVLFLLGVFMMSTGLATTFFKLREKTQCMMKKNIFR